MIVALLFLISAVAAITLVIRSDVRIGWRVAIVFAVILFSLFAYLLATHTSISPFSSIGVVYFGNSSQAPSILVAIIGAVTGVAGSYFFNLGERTIRVRDMARPLATAPLVLIPTIKLVEASGEQSPLALMLLFALSYQNGFFWERLLKPAS
jgi:hypothetical protein